MHEFDYCERVDPSFWAEPINALSNLFFILFAYLAFKHLRSFGLESKKMLAPLLLILVLVAIGAGSFLWHTYASRWAELADVIPITIFMHLYMFYFSRYVLKYKLMTSILFVLSFVGVNYLFSAFADPNVLNGSIAYVPALIYLFLMAKLMGKSPYLKDFSLSIVIFLLSISFRSIDFLVCNFLSAGTHSLWHTLNAIFLYRLIVLMIDVRSRD